MNNCNHIHSRDQVLDIQHNFYFHPCVRKNPETDERKYLHQRDDSVLQTLEYQSMKHAFSLSV